MEVKEIKQVIVVRRDIRMGKGKAAVQVAHASCEVVFKILDSGNKTWLRWLELWKAQGQMKVVLKVDSEEKLMKTLFEAQRAGLPVALIVDAGRTQLPSGTKTAVAIGPAPKDFVDRITGSLKLY